MNRKVKCVNCGYELELPMIHGVIDGRNIECPKCGGRKFMVEDTIEIHSWWEIFINKEGEGR